MATTVILNFWNREILLAIRVARVGTHQRAKFCQNRSVGSEYITFFNFSRWRPSTILDLFGAYLDNPQWVLRGLYHSAKFAYDRCSSFYNMNISIFGTFGWKILITKISFGWIIPIHASKIGVFGQFDPVNGLLYQPSQKRHTLVCYFTYLPKSPPMNGFPPNFAQL